METVFPPGSALFQQDGAPRLTAGRAEEWFEKLNEDMVSPISHVSLSIRGMCWKTSLINGGPTPQLTGLKRSAANILVPDTTAPSEVLQSRGVLGSEQCWWQKGDLDDMWHMVIMLWLMGVLIFHGNH